MWFRVAAAAIAFTAASQAQAQTDYPNRPVRFVVGFEAGGGVDRTARILAKELGEQYKRTLIVENKPGATGNIGADYVAKAAPDGYTLLVTSVVHAINASAYKSLPFDPVKDFEPITTVNLAPNALAVAANQPYKTMAEFIAYAKARPGEVPIASAGAGTLQDMGMVLYEQLVGIKLLHVPYNGTGPSLTAVMNGDAKAITAGYGLVEPFGKDGRMRILGIATKEPSELAPGVPTMAAAGNVPGYEAVSWLGVFAPKGTSPAITAKLNADIRAMVARPEMRTFLVSIGYEPSVRTQAEFAELVRTDIAKYAELNRLSGVVPQ